MLLERDDMDMECVWVLGDSQFDIQFFLSVKSMRSGMALGMAALR